MKNQTIVSSSSSGGIGFIGLLQIVFIVLKILKIINWSWAVVLIPLWISLGLLVLGIIFLIIVWAIDNR